MPLRQIEVVVPQEGKKNFDKLLNEKSVKHYWINSSEDSGYILKAIVDANNTEFFLDAAEEIIEGKEGFRLVITAVEATLPRIEDEHDETDYKDEIQDAEPWEKPLQGVRVSREELYNDISDNVGINSVYIALVSFSTIVAALGILRDNTAVVIGAMVIAPLLGPNVGLALSTTLGDFKLFKKSINTNAVGLTIGFLLAVLLGLLLPVDETINEIASRTEVHLSDIALALASGAAGVLAYTIGMSAAVIGVMVAVALLPPLVTTGLLVGDMQFELAFYSFVLVLTNVICLNLAAVATFKLQGISPRTWYKAEKAKKINRIAFSIWIVLALLVTVIIWFV
ncbi:MAG: TIGR00341 family protein [Balneolaceae bacterium]|nr:MAG: TIGR00341 family protein [Balneolaceae bacterium]